MSDTNITTRCTLGFRTWSIFLFPRTRAFKHPSEVRFYSFPPLWSIASQDAKEHLLTRVTPVHISILCPDSYFPTLETRTSLITLLDIKLQRTVTSGTLQVPFQTSEIKWVSPKLSHNLFAGGEPCLNL